MAEYTMLQKMNDFIDVVTIYFAKQPSRITRIRDAITHLAADRYVTLKTVLAMMDPILRDHPLVMEKFLQVWPTGKPPERWVDLKLNFFVIQWFVADFLKSSTVCSMRPSLKILPARWDLTISTKYTRKTRLRFMRILNCRCQFRKTIRMEAIIANAIVMSPRMGILRVSRNTAFRVERGWVFKKKRKLFVLIFEFIFEICFCSFFKFLFWVFWAIESKFGVKIFDFRKFNINQFFNFASSVLNESF